MPLGPPKPRPCRSGQGGLVGCVGLKLGAALFGATFSTEQDAILYLKQQSGLPSPEHLSVFKRKRAKQFAPCDTAPRAFCYDLLVKNTLQNLGQISFCPCCESNVASMLWVATP